ncbi:MAG: DNA polymerase IV [Promethearchaeota archaeon]
MNLLISHTMKKLAFSSPRIVAHLDMDCYYASVEMAKDPSLRGTPVVVGANPKNGKGRGVVLTCSYEARERGVHIGMPISKAYRLCPDANYRNPDLTTYRDVSKRIMKSLETFANKGFVRQASIDEAYIDVTTKAEEFENPIALAHRIQWQIWRNEKITCSIGLAPNMSVAKIAANHQKPHGVTWVKSTDVQSFLRPLPIVTINGIGKRRAQELERKGYRIIGDLQDLSRQKFFHLFGKHGDWLWNRIRGIDNRPVTNHRYVRRKSMSHNRTFPQDVLPEEREKLEETISKFTHRLGERLDRYALAYRTITLRVRYADFKTQSRSVSLSSPRMDQETLLKVLNEILQSFLKQRAPIRMLGVAVSNLTNKNGQKKVLDWFEE